MCLRQGLNSTRQGMEGESVLSVWGGCQSKSSIRTACGLQDEALQEAEAKREMCYF